MAAFKDNTGREWAVSIDVNAVKRVRSLLDVDLLDIVDGKLVERLVGDPVLVCDVIYAVCKPQADKDDITDEDFGRAMLGDAIDAAVSALLESLVNFTPNQRDRANLRKVIEATDRAMDRARDVIEQRIDSGELDTIVDRVLANAGKPSTDAQASSESTRDH